MKKTLKRMLIVAIVVYILALIASVPSVYNSDNTKRFRHRCFDAGGETILKLKTFFNHELKCLKTLTILIEE